MKSDQSAKLISFLPLASAVGFALPIFARSAQSDLLVQVIDERRGIVKGFSNLDLDGALPIPVEDDLFVQIGDPQIFVFVARGGDALCGSLERLTPNLRSCAEEMIRHVDIRLQIYELVGSDEEKRAARASHQDKVERELGERSGKFFFNASLRGELWDMLLQDAPDDEAADRILSIRSRLDASLDEVGEVQLNLQSLDQRDSWWIDTEKVRAELRERFTFPSGLSGAKNWKNELEDSDLLFHGIEAARQEERVVLLLHALLSDSANAWLIANAYTPRTRFEQKCLQIIRRHFEPGALPGVGVAKLAQYCAFRIFQEVYPRNRGLYLLFLSRHLGGQEEVAGFVKDKLLRSNAVDVIAYKDEIFAALSHERDAI